MNSNLTNFSSNLFLMSSFIIKDNNISFADISTIINKDFKLSIDNTIIEKIIASRKIFENTINNSDDKFYGIGTTLIPYTKHARSKSAPLI